ncbi:MAG: hypothetical protein EBZ77_14525, partial [Chitinophagia bacterium]|nr:hypothetical protein [Chitinophagia bacterium]
MFKYLLLSVLSLLSFAGFASVIKGTVSEEKNASPMVGVIVSVKPSSDDTSNAGKTVGTVTDIDGNFEVTGVKAGNYEVTFTYLTFTTETRSVTLSDKGDVILNVKMKPETKELKEFTIKANKVTHTDIALVNEIRNSTSVVSGISASQITKTLDRSAADVVKRVPGVTIRDDRFIIVRGLPDRYNTVWLNDAGTPSSETDKKSFSFDIIPSGLIDRVLIFKSPSPDLPGDFAGGMAKVYTTSIQEKNELNVQFQTSSRSYTTGRNFVTGNTSPTDWMGFDDGTRSIPGVADVRRPINKNDSNINAISKSFGNDWKLKNANATPDVRFAVSAFNVWKLKKVKLGNTFGLSYATTSVLNNQLRQKWDDTNLVYKFNDMQYQKNTSVGILDNIAAIIGNSKIEFKN